MWTLSQADEAAKKAKSEAEKKKEEEKTVSLAKYCRSCVDNCHTVQMIRHF